jgi:hypothetical protein
MLDEGCSTVYCEASAAVGSYLSDGLEPQGRKLASELGNAATFVREALPRLSGSVFMPHLRHSPTAARPSQIKSTFRMSRSAAAGRCL